MKRKAMILGLVLGGCAFAGTWDVAVNFNATNNPSASGVFSYGWGGTPASFIAMSVTAQDGSGGCLSGSPTECLNNGIGFPSTSSIVWNGTGTAMASGTPNFFPGFLNLDPQSSGGAIVRFTAPFTDVYSMTGNYKGDDSGQNATKGWVYHDSTPIESVDVNTFLALSPISFSGLSLTAGETIDFIVTSNSGCCFLSTGLGAVITSQTAGATPEPSSMLLMAAGLVLVIRRRGFRVS